MNLRRCLAGFVLASLTSVAAAQNYPNKPIRLIVPFPAGGGTDFLARVVANKLSETLKWVIVVDNRPGAGGNIGVDAVAKAPADGYSIVMGQTSNLAINPTLYSKLPYDPLKDLMPVVLVADAPLGMVVSSQSPYKSLADIVAAAKAKPGDLTYASPGNGTVAHLAFELFQDAAGIKLTHIPYKGAAQAMPDVMGGAVALYMSSMPTVLPHVKNGKLRPIAVLTGTPRVAESGYKDFQAITWFGFLVPAGTPQEIVTRLNTEVNKVLKMPDVAKKIATEGGGTLGGTPEQFALLLKDDLVKWGKVVKNAGVKLD